MIQSKKDLEIYKREDFLANHFHSNSIMRFFDIRYRFIVRLRKTEFHINTHRNSCITYLSRFMLSRLSIKTGITIIPNTFGKGLYIPHYGCIVVNETARFGDYCVIQCGVNISANASGGNHIYFGAGAKILKDVHIPDNVIVGANAVVSKSITEENICVGGIPAHKISDHGFASREGKPI